MRLKNLFTGLLIVYAIGSTLPMEAYAQRKGKGGPPAWAPANGYRAQTRHVYFPSHNFYYDTQRNVYIYPSGSTWLIRPSLPSFYGKLDLRSASKIELDLQSDAPHRHNSDHKSKYNGKSYDHPKKSKPAKAAPAKESHSKSEHSKGSHSKGGGDKGGKGKGGKNK